MTEDKLTQKILMQNQIANIENRLEELRKPININDNSDDDMGMPGGSGGRDDDGTPPRPPGRDEFDERTRRLNRLCGNHPSLPPRRPRVRRPDVELDLCDILNNRLNRLRYDSITPNQEEKILAKRLLERQREIAQIPKGTVKSRKSNVGLFQPIFPDTLPPTPNRDDYWSPPPVGPSDNNFIKPQLPSKRQFSPKTKPQLPPKPIIDNFALSLSKIIDDEKNTIQIIPKKKEVGLNETNLSEQLSKIFPNINEVNEQDEEKFKEDVNDLTEILTRIGEDGTPFEFEFFYWRKKQKI